LLVGDIVVWVPFRVVKPTSGYADFLAEGMKLLERVRHEVVPGLPLVDDGGAVDVDGHGVTPSA
jgi:hypothetical protein